MQINLSKMNKSFLIIVIALIGYNSNTFAQDINIDLIGKKFSQAVKLEVKSKGKIYTSDDDIIIPGGMAAPITYTRAGKDVKEFLVEYTFSEKDSVIRRIEYIWGKGNDKEVLKEKFEMFLKSLTEKYGKSAAVSQYQHDWTTQDKMAVSIYGNFTNYPKVIVEVRKDK